MFLSIIGQKFIIFGGNGYMLPIFDCGLIRLAGHAAPLKCYSVTCIKHFNKVTPEHVAFFTQLLGEKFVISR